MFYWDRTSTIVRCLQLQRTAVLSLHRMPVKLHWPSDAFSRAVGLLSFIYFFWGGVTISHPCSDFNMHLYLMTAYHLLSFYYIYACIPSWEGREWGVCVHARVCARALWSCFSCPILWDWAWLIGFDCKRLQKLSHPASPMVHLVLAPSLCPAITLLPSSSRGLSRAPSLLASDGLQAMLHTVTSFSFCSTSVLCSFLRNVPLSHAVSIKDTPSMCQLVLKGEGYKIHHVSQS